MRKFQVGFLFFVGWLLSPFTWWNDAFINIPLSYILASLIFYVIPLPFKWLVIVIYWFTNLVGLFFMYAGGRPFIMSSKNRIMTVTGLILALLAYSAIMLYLDSKGKLVPLWPTRH
jgi:hypothetical protein